MIIDEMTASVQRTLDYPGSISHHLLVVVQSETRIRSDMCARQINALLKRVSYAMDNPDVALRFINDEALLIDIGETGVDHEVMIKLST